MRKRKLCVIWIWYLLYDNVRFQRWLARHRRHGWELADVGFLFFRFERGDGTRYRSLGCAPCTKPIRSESRNVHEIIEELRTGALSNIAERSGRAQDAEDGGGLETLRRGGYM